MTPKPAPKSRRVLDTSLLLIACAIKSSGDSMSELDIDYNNLANGQNPDKLRGLLIGMLTDNTVIVPEIVRLELQGLASGGQASEKTTQGKRQKLSAKNIENIRSLAFVLDNRTTPLLPTREDVLLQKSVWDEIERKAKTDPEMAKAWKNKFAEHARTVANSAQKASLSHSEPWLDAAARIEELRKIELIRPSKGVSRELGQLEELLRDTTPRLVPDFEIFLIALKTGAPVVSRDKDFNTMWKALSKTIQEQYLASIPKVFQKINDSSHEPKSMTQLTAVFEKRVKPFVLRPKSRDKEPGI